MADKAKNPPLTPRQIGHLSKKILDADNAAAKLALVDAAARGRSRQDVLWGLAAVHPLRYNSEIPIAVALEIASAKNASAVAIASYLAGTTWSLGFEEALPHLAALAKDPKRNREILAELARRFLDGEIRDIDVWDAENERWVTTRLLEQGGIQAPTAAFRSTLEPFGGFDGWARLVIEQAKAGVSAEKVAAIADAATIDELITLLGMSRGRQGSPAHLGGLRETSFFESRGDSAKLLEIAARLAKCKGTGAAPFASAAAVVGVLRSSNGEPDPRFDALLAPAVRGAVWWAAGWSQDVIVIDELLRALAALPRMRRVALVEGTGTQDRKTSDAQAFLKRWASDDLFEPTLPAAKHENLVELARVCVTSLPPQRARAIIQRDLETSEGFSAGFAAAATLQERELTTRALARLPEMLEELENDQGLARALRAFGDAGVEALRAMFREGRHLPFVGSLASATLGDSRAGELAREAGRTLEDESAAQAFLRRAGGFSSVKGPKTRVYVLVDTRQPPGEAKSFMGRSAPAEKLEHCVTLDLANAPDVQERLSGARGVSLYLRTYDKVPASAGSKNVRVVKHDEGAFIKHVAAHAKYVEELDEDDREEIVSLELKALDVPGALFTKSPPTALEPLRGKLSNIAYAGGEPIWVQGDESEGDFLLQIPDGVLDSLNLGDAGVLYVFPRTAFMQCM